MGKHKRGASPVINKRKDTGNVSSEKTSLSSYFKDMAKSDVFTPDEESERAQDIVKRELDTWIALISSKRLRPHVCVVVERHIDKPFPKGDAPKVASILREWDSDQDIIRDVLSDLSKLSEEKRCPVFSAQQKHCAVSYQKVLQAKNSFVKANLRLVISIARRFSYGKLAFSDLIQEGNLGLIKAVNRYDHSRGYRFSTYASWWIRHAISRAIADKGRTVRLPVHMIDTYQRVIKARKALQAELCRFPTNEELSEATDIPVRKLEKMKMYLLESPVSLDCSVSESDGRKFVDLLEDPTTSDYNPIDDMGKNEVFNEMMRTLDLLKPIEADILRQRFGLGASESEMTLKDIGEKYNLSRERIRQIQEDALSKIRVVLKRQNLC